MNQTNLTKPLSTKMTAQEINGMELFSIDKLDYHMFEEIHQSISSMPEMKPKFYSNPVSKLDNYDQKRQKFNFSCDRTMSPKIMG